MSENVSLSNLVNSLAAHSKEVANLPNRYQCLMLDFAKRVADSISRSSRSLISIAGLDISGVVNQVYGLRIVFRIFDKTLQLVIPVEFVELLVERFLGGDCKFILSQLTDRELVTISYLAGLVLNDKTVFPKQRAYLQSVELIDDQIVVLGNEFNFSLNVLFEESQFEICVSYCDELNRVFSQLSKCAAPSRQRKAWFTSLRGKTEIEATAQISEISALLHLEVGSKIPLRLKAAKMGVSFGADSFSSSELPLEIAHGLGDETISFNLGR